MGCYTGFNYIVINIFISGMTLVLLAFAICYVRRIITAIFMETLDQVNAIYPTMLRINQMVDQSLPFHVTNQEAVHLNSPCWGPSAPPHQDI